MSTFVVSQDFELELPGEEWIDHSFHALVLPDGKLSCFVARDLGDDLAAALAERARYITDGASDVRNEKFRDGWLGPLESREVAVVAREDHMWIYYRLSSVFYGGGILTIGVYGPEANRQDIDQAMDDIAAGILFRRLP
ncbi:hypothetical protein A7982_12828 [Minicystis rosea]|nr:hypothetical protein A7982_12828 [Minicystis rosea]